MTWFECTMINEQSTKFLEMLLKIPYLGSMVFLNYMGMTIPIETRTKKELFKMVGQRKMSSVNVKYC